MGYWDPGGVSGQGSSRGGSQKWIFRTQSVSRVGGRERTKNGKRLVLGRGKRNTANEEKGRTGQKMSWSQKGLKQKGLMILPWQLLISLKIQRNFVPHFSKGA